jgi:DNA polymerase I
VTPRERLVLVDGNALVHRAFHAIGPLMTSRGELVNATFGFASMLLTSLQMIKPDCVAVAFDMAAPTFRKVQFDAYKAHRPHMPGELAGQLPRVRQIVETLGIPIYETTGFEADDVLGTLSVQAVEQGLDVTIVTGDLDALQLVNDHVTVLINRRGVQDTMQYDPAAVRERFGFAPLQLPDYKALVGDTSDNIPKVPGIGEKTASDLVARYGDVEGVLAHLDEIKPRNAEPLREMTEQVRQSKVLATIRRDAPVSFERDRCVLARYDRDQAKALLLELEFRSLLGKLPASEDDPEEAAEVPTAGRQVVAPATLGQAALFPELAIPAAPAAKPEVDASLDYTIVRNEEQLAAMLTRLQQATAIAFDVETTAPDEITSELVGVSLSPASHVGFYIPVGHHPEALVGADGAAEGQLSPEQALPLLRPILEDAGMPKYAHNAKFDITVLARYGVRVQGLVFDTMVAAYLLNQRGLGLKDMALRELGVEMTQITDLIGKGSKQISMADVPVDAAGYYACADVDLTYRLVAHLEPQLRAQGLDRLNQEIEVPLIDVLSAMELEGVAIDLAQLQELSRDLGAKLFALEREIVALAGHPFNINSTQQLAKVLFEELKLPSGARTKTGYSTSSDVLELLRGRHEIVAKVMEYRELIKLKSTYVDGLPALINPRDGRVHTSFNQTVVATGRLSSTDPNLQNIPARSELGRLIRAAFVPGRPGWLLLAADYSQVELRVLAHLSRDPALLAAFLGDQDIHSATASKIFGVEADAVTSNQRRIAKVINFGILYGMGGQAVARQGEVSRQEGDAFITQYFATFPQVRQYIDQTKREAVEQGYVTTITGRRRTMPELQDPRREIRAAGERAAVNAPVQGSAADIIKIAMVRLQQQLCERQLAGRMILQVHDELVFEVPEAELATVADLVRTTMESAMELAVPLKVEVKVGTNWAAMRAVEEAIPTLAHR